MLKKTNSIITDCATEVAQSVPTMTTITPTLTATTVAMDEDTASSTAANLVPVAVEDITGGEACDAVEGGDFGFGLLTSEDDTALQPVVTPETTSAPVDAVTSPPVKTPKIVMPNDNLKQQPGSQTTAATTAAAVTTPRTNYGSNLNTPEQRQQDKPSTTAMASEACLPKTGTAITSSAASGSNDINNGSNNNTNEINTSSNSNKGKKKKRQQGFRKAPQAPRRFKSPYILFSISKMAEYKNQAKEDGETTKVTAISKRIADEWKALSKEERAKWDEVAMQDKLRYNAEKELYTGPWQVPSKRSRKDPSAPKRPPSAFLFYCQTQRPKLKAENPDMKNTQISVLLGKQWKNAPEALRQVHIKREQKERELYKIEIAKWREQRQAEEKLQKEQRQAMTEYYLKNNNGSKTGAEIASSYNRAYNMTTTTNTTTTVPPSSSSSSASSSPTNAAPMAAVPTTAGSGNPMGTYRYHHHTSAPTPAVHPPHPPQPTSSTSSSSWRNTPAQPPPPKLPERLATKKRTSSEMAAPISTPQPPPRKDVDNKPSPQQHQHQHKHQPSHHYHHHHHHHGRVPTDTPQLTYYPETHDPSPDREHQQNYHYDHYQHHYQYHHHHHTPMASDPAMDHSYSNDLYQMPLVFPGVDDAPGVGTREDDDPNMFSFEGGLVDDDHHHHSHHPSSQYHSHHMLESTLPLQHVDK